MTPKDIADFERFLAAVGKADLFAYFSVAPDATDEEVGDAIQTRRTWAQGQQGNPKFKTEAIWLIKNASRVRRALLEERDAYRAHLSEVAEQQQVEVLRMVIFGALAGGVLSVASEAAVRAEGEKLGLAGDRVTATLEAMLREHGARREAATDGADSFVDYYAILRVMPTADRGEIDRAYRDRYRQALQLPDKKRAEVLQRHLDRAVEVLSSSSERVRYDQIRSDILGEDAGDAPPTLGTRAGTPERELEASETPHRIQFRAGDEPAPDLSRPVAPTPPNEIGKTLGFADAPRAAAAPGSGLSVDGPAVVPVRVRAQPVTRTFVVRKRGARALPARVLFDRDWLEVNPERLDPNADQQEVAVTVYPERLSRPRSVALLTFTTADNLRQTVTLEVKRQPSVSWLAAGAVAAAGLLAVVGSGLLSSSGPEPAPTSAELEVVVDPPAGEISINNEPVEQAQPGRVLLSAGLEPGATAFVRVASDGFRSWSQSVTLPGPGERLTLTPALELSDRVNYVPGSGDIEGSLDRAEAQATLMRADGALADCARRHGAPSEGDATLAVTVFVDNKGVVVGAEALPEGFAASAELSRCVRRQLRVLRMPFAQGDFARLSRSLRVSSSP